MPLWTCKPHAELTLAELYAILRLRSEVFVVEQDCVFLDMDGKDLQGQTEHLMAWENGALLAYCRLLEPALNDGQAVIGRVITAPAARGTGLGHELMRRAKDEVARLWPGQPVYLGAQARLRAYYAGHGFVPVTEEYIEDGIPHVGMLLREAA
ncbi:acyltransferase [Achromobacter xylosoxidans]|jgi:ElaA protein|uniref:GNAT family N-acetyltransferase n=1 Tax=Achromobacter ruhlandii TaxID=72557 RepID=UPI0006C2A78E|nr:GNAT family N-acetyltransferase [Achromobacter ruhlandii]ALX82938.1 acyltransferase [Achromobacter denitrificans]AMG47720.1 GNAT family N-acetyltransferase [Achromobacter xylosoxidans]MCI1837191.1 GNAT family N-acetyltransferase [Achromobacter ruhlandii]OCZ64685.1 acyltransferase [Achromobacter xylosoxidans]OCZ66160.1 acyltransferase [Achromobacter xylosoxidans]